MPFITRFMFTVLMVAMLSSCAQMLVVNSEPNGAKVVVKNSRGNLVAEGAAPLKFGVNFDGDSAYQLEIQPTEDQENFQVLEKLIGPEDYAEFSALSENLKTVSYPLEEKPYVALEEVVETLNSEGEWVVVKVKRRSFKDIAEAGGSVPSLLYDMGDNKGITGIDLSPDGNRIVFSVASYEKSLNEIEEATTLNGGGLILPSKGSNIRVIRIGSAGTQFVTTENFNDKFPVFSPNGEYIIFASNRRRTDLSDILRIKATGRSGVSDIYVNHRQAMLLKPSFANNGSMAFELCKVDNRGGRVAVGDHFVWAIPKEGGYPTQIVRGAQPKISPDGKLVAYIGEDGNLWVSDIDGTHKTQLTTNAESIVEKYLGQLNESEKLVFNTLKAGGIRPIYPYSFPSWSANGGYLVYSSMEGSDSTGRPNEDIWLMRPDGSGKQQLTTNGSTDKYPLLSPDSGTIYFMSNRGERWALWKIDSGINTRAVELDELLKNDIPDVELGVGPVEVKGTSTAVLDDMLQAGADTVRETE